MPEPVTHLAHADWPGATLCGLGFTAMSGQPRGPVAADPAAVTCTRCRKSLERGGGGATPRRAGRPDLLAELDEASVAAGEVCWCGRHPEDCDEAGGCAFTRQIAAVAAARDEEIAYLTDALKAELGRHAPLDTDWGKVCSYCWIRGGSRALWPCTPAVDLASSLHR